MPRFISKISASDIISDISLKALPLLNEVKPKQLATIYFKHNFDAISSLMNLSGHKLLMNLLTEEYLNDSNSADVKQFYLELLKFIPLHFTSLGEANEFIVSKFNAHNLSSITEDIANKYFQFSSEENLDFRSDNIKLSYSTTLSFSNLVFFINILINKLTCKKNIDGKIVPSIIKSNRDVALAILLLSYASLSVFTTISYIGVELNKMNQTAIDIIQDFVGQMVPKYFANYFRYCMNVFSPFTFMGFKSVFGEKLERVEQDAFVTIIPFVSSFFRITTENNFVMSIKIVANAVQHTSGSDRQSIVKLLKEFDTIEELNRLLGRNVFDFSGQDEERIGPIAMFINSTIGELSNASVPLNSFNLNNEDSLNDFFKLNLILCIVSLCCKCDVELVESEWVSVDYYNRLPDFLFEGFLDNNGNIISVPSWRYGESSVDAFAYSLTLNEIRNINSIEEFNLAMIKHQNFLITSKRSYNFLHSLLNRLEFTYFGTFNENTNFIADDPSILEVINIYQPPVVWRNVNISRSMIKESYIYTISEQININSSGENGVAWDYGTKNYGNSGLSLKSSIKDDMIPNEDYEPEFGIANLTKTVILRKQKRIISEYTKFNGMRFKFGVRCIKEKALYYQQSGIDNIEMGYNRAKFFFQNPMNIEEYYPAVPLYDGVGIKKLVFYVMTLIYEFRGSGNLNFNAAGITSDFTEYVINEDFRSALEEYCYNSNTERLIPKVSFGGNEISLRKGDNTDPTQEFWQLNIEPIRKEPKRDRLLSTILPNYARVNHEMYMYYDNEIREMKIETLISHKNFKFIGNYYVNRRENIFVLSGMAINYYNPNKVLEVYDRFNLRADPVEDGMEYIYTDNAKNNLRIMSNKCKTKFEFDRFITKLSKNKNTGRTCSNYDQAQFASFINNIPEDSIQYLYNGSRFQDINLSIKEVKKILKVMIKRCNFSKT